MSRPDEDPLIWIERARDEAAAVALWAFEAREKTPRRRFMRRRFLQGVWREKHRQAAELADDVARLQRRARETRVHHLRPASEVPREGNR